MVCILLVVLTCVMFDNVPDPPATNPIMARSNVYAIGRVPPVALSDSPSHYAVLHTAYRCLEPDLYGTQCHNIPVQFTDQVTDLSPPVSQPS
jgi:hypothetical protein